MLSLVLLAALVMLPLGQTQPDITNGPVDTTVCNGFTVNITCGFSSSDPGGVIIMWRIVMRNDDGDDTVNDILANSIANNSGGNLRWISDLISPNESVLEVGPVNETYSHSSFQCIILRSPNNIESEPGILIIAGPPSPVNNLVVTRGCLGIDSSWSSVTSDPVCNPLFYVVTTTPYVGNITVMENSHSISGLLSNNIYTVTVAGENNAGVGESSDMKMSDVAGPPLSIRSITQTVTCTVYTTISWNNASTIYSECGPTLYDVMILHSNRTMMYTNTMMETSYRITGLTPNQRYTVTVTSRNIGGEGGSNMTEINTPTVTEALPIGDLNVREAKVEHDSITVMWDNISSRFCGGIVYYQVVLLSGEQVLYNRSTAEVSVTFDDLEADTTYSVMVIAFNDAGGRMPSSIDVTTDPSPFLWWIIVIIVVLVCVGCCTSSIFIFCCEKEETEGCVIKCCYITLIICSFGMAPLVWFLFDSIRKCGSKDKSEKNSTCFLILAICSCGLTIVLWWTYLKARSCKVKDGGDAPDSQNMPLKDTNKPPRSAAEEQSLYSYARTGPINVVMEGGSSVHPSGDKPRQT